ncbi:Uncharacterized protein AArcCO_2297 [Halalkaliarchaeum sp. AArc-CO]|uniref:hypothetical protein n=1 Tax=unclassified Halalkaliarchaeum TaxID=2678344 RepID=UPI00217DBD2A|nr:MULTISPECIES: hypothetical protein [unclassified Halalkaliarchaeum]MDR5672093.1 hypothetical protein [Halalkaliarchaeum sp. AArc-GB]UWG51591.1 Uncharacterized protein AArcCO_2297 [Halalkaliarchaeum sp. AArc-CO]
MSSSQSTDRSRELADLFVAVTGDERVTEPQQENYDREIRGENRIDEAVRDGLEDAIAGAEPNPGDPGNPDDAGD